MKNLTVAITVAAATALAGGPVSAATIACSDLDMSQLTSMVGSMADGAHKWQMYGYLADINTATARNGARGFADRGVAIFFQPRIEIADDRVVAHPGRDVAARAFASQASHATARSR